MYNDVEYQFFAYYNYHTKNIPVGNRNKNWFLHLKIAKVIIPNAISLPRISSYVSIIIID